MHKASHPELRLAGDEVPDPDLIDTCQPGGIEKISFKWVQEITMAKEQLLQRMILNYDKP